MPIPVAARSVAWDCGRSRVEIVGLNPAGDMEVSLLCVTDRGLGVGLIASLEESYRVSYV
jgi:hypothetical protein